MSWSGRTQAMRATNTPSPTGAYRRVRSRRLVAQCRCGEHLERSSRRCRPRECRRVFEGLPCEPRAERAVAQDAIEGPAQTMIAVDQVTGHPAHAGLTY